MLLARELGRINPADRASRHPQLETKSNGSTCMIDLN